MDFNPRFGILPLSWRLIAAAGLLVLAGCGHTQWHYLALRDVSVTLPAMVQAQPTMKRAGTPAEPLEVNPGGQRSVLVATEVHDDPEEEFDHWSRSFVVVLDGPPAKGKVEVSPANGRLIYAAPFRPARRPYVGLEGYVNILAVRGSKVIAYCVLRSEIRDAYDKLYVVRGFYEFQTATGSEPFLHGGGLQVAP